MITVEQLTEIEREGIVLKAEFEERDRLRNAALLKWFNHVQNLQNKRLQFQIENPPKQLAAEEKK